jgi:hypothetical protein
MNSNVSTRYLTYAVAKARNRKATQDRKTSSTNNFRKASDFT